MATSIKITALSDIGANVSFSTLVPVVDMAGTPTTEKANLQIIGNLILAGSGTGNFVTATRALTSGTVTSAAQANITSVGTLTGLTVSGNVAAGNVAATNFTGSLTGVASVATVAGTVTSAAQANITSVGTLSGLAVSGDMSTGATLTFANLAVSGGTPAVATDTVISHKIPVVINGVTYFIALTEAL